MLHGYPVLWDTTSNLYKNIVALHDRAVRNIYVLSNPTQGAVDCYNYPDQCIDITKRIMENIETITQEDLGFLSELQYTYPIYYEEPVF